MTEKMIVKRGITEVTMPAGDYYVGDPCYTVPDHLWMTWLEAADYETENILAAEVAGHPVLGIGGFGGDGVYAGSDGNEYPVDAGVLGLVPAALAREHGVKVRDDLVKLKRFATPIKCSLGSDGHVRLGNLVIYTN